MVKFNIVEKEQFTRLTQMQNVGRLFRMVLAKSLKTLLEVSDVDKYNSSTSNTNEFRLTLWLKLRCMREMLVKSLTITALKEHTLNIQVLVKYGARLYNILEAARTRPAALQDAIWSSNTSLIAVPPFDIDTAVNMMVLGDPYSLPRFTELAVCQATMTPDEAVKNLNLSENTKKFVIRRLEESLWTQLAMSLSHGALLKDSIMSSVNFTIINGRVTLFIANQFEVTFITNESRFQIESFKILTGNTACRKCLLVSAGKRICLCPYSAELTIMGNNSLSSYLNIISESLFYLRQRLQYEVNAWKAGINATKEVRNRINSMRALYFFLKAKGKIDFDALASMLLEKIKLLSIDYDAFFDNDFILKCYRDNLDSAFDSLNANFSNDLPPIEADFETFTLDLYKKMRNFESKCLENFYTAKEHYESLEGNNLVYEYYRFITFVASRYARYNALLLLYDQARVAVLSIITTGGLLCCNLRKDFPEEVKKEICSDSFRMPGWYKLFWKYFPSTELDSIAEKYPNLGAQIPFSCFFTEALLPVHTDILNIDFLPGLPLTCWPLQNDQPFSVAVPKLIFYLKNSTSEFGLLLEPLNELLKSENLDPIFFDKIYALKSLKFFYVMKDTKLVNANTSDCNFIRKKGLRLSVFIDYAVLLLSEVTLIALELNFQEQNFSEFSTKRNGNLLHLLYNNSEIVVFTINIVTGKLDLSLDTSMLCDTDFESFLNCTLKPLVEQNQYRVFLQEISDHVGFKKLATKQMKMNVY